ncbi:MAG: phage tail protein [Paludibacteraceae bacterium]|nr:phage tail protein [Paludibacteraceae bacterium]
MIRLFGQTDKSFLTNGNVVISPLKAKVHKKDNGDYYLALETTLEYLDYFVEGNIVVANTPTGDQAFRIGNVQKTKNKITTKCYHVFYDSKNYLIADSNVVEKNCNNALVHLNNATEPLTEFTVSSDVTKVESFRCVRKSLYEAIETVLERWGGHLVRDNFTIQIKNQIGVDNGIIVQYKKNLKDISCSENWDNVVTKLLPVGKDGILLNDLDPSASIYVTSSTQYAIPYTKTVSFEQDIDEDDYQTETQYKQALIADLYEQATAYVAKNCVPQVNYTLKANLEKVTDIGDVVEVIDSRLNLHLLTYVIGFEYDCIAKRYTEVEFGNFTQNISGLGNFINSTARNQNLGIIGHKQLKFNTDGTVSWIDIE